MSPTLSSAHGAATARPLAPPPDIRPLAGPQLEASLSEADELLYGGAAGGGKTFLQVGLAVMAHQSSIIFRREATQATEIEDTLDGLLEGYAVAINHNTRRWTLPGGRIVEIGSMPRPYDWRKYKGRPHDLLAFDELSEFTREQYRMSIVWNRTVKQGQRTRVVAGTNPPTSEEERWIIEEWAPWLDPAHPEPARPGELRWYAYEGERIVWQKTADPIEVDGRTVHPKSRTFIPARLEDNPYLLATDYGRALDALPEEIRRAFRDGDFQASAIEDPWSVIPTAWIRAAMDRVPSEVYPVSQLGVDPARGGRDQTVICVRRSSVVEPLRVYPGKTTPDGPAVAALAMRHAEDGCPIVVDAIGIGSSVVDALAANGLPTVAFNSSEASTYGGRSGYLRFANRRAEVYWRLREALDPNLGDGISLPSDPLLAAELASPRFKPTVRGIQLEPKDAIKERLGRSPDRADAVAYAFAPSPVLVAFM
jgi:hypothetical protein